MFGHLMRWTLAALAAQPERTETGYAPAPPLPSGVPPATDAELWTAEKLKNPHAASDKARRVRDMFAAISGSYDLNNRLFSLGIDRRWRRRAVKLSALKPLNIVIDVACGTGDLSICYAKALAQAQLLAMPQEEIHPSVVGIDFTFEMLPPAKRKSQVANPKLDIPFIAGDAMALPLPDACCDVVSIAFGIRNVTDPAAALAEFRRVLRPGGRVVVLEFSLPTNPAIRAVYNFYFNQVLTRAATVVSGDKTGAYHYLSASVNTFIGRSEMVELMRAAGFERVEQHPLTFGVAVCYVGRVAN